MTIDRQQLAEHLRFFQDLGVTGISRDAEWRRREMSSRGSGGSKGSRGSGSEPVEPIEPEPLEPREPFEPREPRQQPKLLTVIREDLGDCTRCKLHAQGRRQIVFGVGNANADLMFVGEAPGADEDIQGIPFVGRAGQLLTKMIEAMGYQRDDVYIANVIKCRPPGNRNPEPDEIAQCEPFLVKQIEAIQPKVIVALGKFAAQTLLRTGDPISRIRGRVYTYHGAQLIPTFHPSFLLRSPGFKREAWADLKKARALLQEPEE